MATERRKKIIEHSKKVNLLSNPNFKWVIEEAPMVSLFSQTFELPGVQVQPAPVDNPFVQMKLQGDMADFADLTFSFIVDENLDNYYEIYAWLMHMSFPRAFTQFKIMSERKTMYPELGRSDISAMVLTNKTNYIEQVKFVQCHPIALGNITFDHTSSDVIHPTCSVTFTYDYFVLMEKDRTNPSEVFPTKTGE